MKVNSINRQVRSQQHLEAESSGPGGRTGSSFFKDIGGKGKVSQQDLQPDRPEFQGGKKERNEFQEGPCPSEHWGGAREEEKHTCSLIIRVDVLASAIFLMSLSGNLVWKLLWKVRTAPVMESRHLRSLFTDP